MLRIILGLLLAVTLNGQADPLSPLRFLEGKWRGEASGKPGKGVTDREYKFEFSGRFLSARNRSVYEPKTADGKSEVHEDLGMFSHDRAAKKIVLRQFHREGFVNEYTLDAVTDGGRTLEFVTVRIENIPAGWRAKEIYRVLSDDEWTETFWLAEPGKDFELYSQAHLKRVK